LIPLRGGSLKALIKVIPESRFPKWATTLASMICTNPELANLTNEELAARIENESGETGFDHTIISKKLSIAQSHLVSDILHAYGYATDTLVNGTDIKKIVKNNVRTAALKDDGVIFYADGMSIKGRSYKYKQRESTPTGKPWTDFSIRMSGQDIKLQNILFLRDIGINEFINRDEAACATASPEQTARRQALNRAPQQSRQLKKIMAVNSPNKNGDGAVSAFKAMRPSDHRFGWEPEGLIPRTQ
jgi:hypothetical protein